MLRLISIIGIAIAMVVGFVAISSKMKDDYTARSRIVDVIDQMKNIAAEELQCGEISNAGTEADTENTKNQNIAANEVPSAKDTRNIPEIEISKDLEPIPLVDAPDSDQSTATPPSDTLTDESSANEISNETADSSSDNSSSQSEQPLEQSSPTSATLEDNELERNADIIKTMGYRRSISGAIEVVVIFKDLNGESGKTLVNSGSQLAIRCMCGTNALSCSTLRSSINKNYLPKSLTKE